MSKKRVVIDVNSVMPLYRRGWLSGIGRTTKELVEALNKVDELPFDIILYSQNTKCVKASLMQTHFSTRHLPLPHKPWINHLLGITHLRELTTRYDLLHIPHNFEWVRCPQKTVITLHDAMFMVRPDETFDHAYAQKHYPKLARKCQGIITCSNSSKRDIMQYMDIPEEKIFVTPWGYKEDIFYHKPAKKTGHPYFLSVSCSLGRKNTMAVIKAYERLIKQNPINELVLVWPNTPQEALHYCNQDHLRNHIYITTDVDDERLSVLYNEATATIFPSLYEGFGLPVLESLACGTPVVTSNNSSLPEVGGDAAFYVDPNDIEALTKYMERFENNEFNHEALKQKCLLQASHFSWSKCAQQTIQAYTHFLS